MSGISACSRLQVSGNTKYRLYSCTLYRVPVHCIYVQYRILLVLGTVVFFATVQYTYSTVLHGARMYTVVNTGTVRYRIRFRYRCWVIP
eukprot:COSAG05_NODE_71_length_22071_cov_17.527149_7_plen_89_part_00